jgi:hypothetical protein
MQCKVTADVDVSSRVMATISRRGHGTDRPAWQRQGRQDNPIYGPGLARGENE